MIRQMRLLGIEDEEKLAQVVKRALVAETFSVDVAHDGREGLDLANSYDYDLIVLDLLLPQMEGSEVLRRVRRRNPRVPVLILTARDAVTDKVAHFEAGADDTSPSRLQWQSSSYGSKLSCGAVPLGGRACSGLM